MGAEIAQTNTGVPINFWQIFASLLVGYIIAELKDWNKTRSSKKNLKKYLTKSFQFNLERCDQMIGQLTPQNNQVEVPNYPFDTDTIKNEISKSINLFKTEKQKKLLDEINWRRYQLDHLNYKLPALSMHPEAGALATHLHHLRREKEEIQELLIEIDRFS